jgi:hypothetical protein
VVLCGNEITVGPFRGTLEVEDGSTVTYQVHYASLTTPTLETNGGIRWAFDSLGRSKTYGCCLEMQGRWLMPAKLSILLSRPVVAGAGRGAGDG